MDSLQVSLIWMTIGTVVATTSFVWEMFYAPYTHGTARLLPRVLPMWAVVLAMMLAVVLWPVTLVMSVREWQRHRKS